MLKGLLIGIVLGLAIKYAVSDTRWIQHDDFAEFKSTSSFEQFKQFYWRLVSAISGGVHWGTSFFAQRFWRRCGFAMCVEKKAGPWSDS